MPDSAKLKSVRAAAVDRKMRVNDYFVDEPMATTAVDIEQFHDDDGSLESSVATHTLASIREGILHTTSHYKILLFGQFISLMMASLWATQSTLFLRCNLSAPAFTNIFVFLILSINIIPLYRQGLRIKADNTLPDPPYWILRGTLPLHMSPWRYLGVVFIGFEANYLMMLALRFTTLTSAALFDALAIPSAMILSAAVLKRNYRFAHLLGAAICLLGMAINIISDFMSNYLNNNAETSSISIKTISGDQERDDGSDEYPHKLIGDALAICGGILYGINDVLAEICVRNNGGIHEYLAILSLWGILLAGIQAAIFERQAIAGFFHDGACSAQISLLLLAAYIACQVIRKTALSYFVLISEAALLNLSMLTSDLYTTTFSVVAQDILPRPFFFVGLFMVLSGIFMYEMAPSPVAEYAETQDDVRMKTNINVRPQTNIAAIEFTDGGLEMRELRQRNVS